MKYFFGGYYLIRPRKADFGSIKNKEFLTCSSCINDTLYDSWAISWATPFQHQTEKLRNEFNISEEQQKEVQQWADTKFEEKRIGWIEVFSDLETVQEYSERFFRHIKNKVIMKISFPENEMNDFLSDFKPEEYGALGLYNNLIKKEETQIIKNEEFIGYDLIGIELSGNFHTFHCHDLSNELNSRFGIELNEYGLIKEIENPKEVIDFMNDESNGFETIPWYLVRVSKCNNVAVFAF